MASNEKQFKHEIVEAARAEGAHVVVISGSYLAGIPDLYVKYPELPGFWLELKYVKGASRIVNLSPLQRAWLARERAVGGMPAWVLCAQTTPRAWSLYIGRDPSTLKADGRHLYECRSAGEKWHPYRILRRLTEQYEHTGK